MKKDISSLSILSKKLIANFHQYRAGIKTEWNSGSQKVLLLTEENRISQSQIFPFFFYQRDFQKEFNLNFIEINIEKFDEKNTQHVLKGADLIFYQPWFLRGEKQIKKQLKQIRSLNASCKVVFLDAYAPLDLRFANTVNDYIDIYYKKSILKDLSIYEKPTYGDTHLIEYYNELYGLERHEEIFFDVPQSFFTKLKLAPGFFTSHEMLPKLSLIDHPVFKEKKYDVHARLGAEGVPWYQAMRQASLSSCKGVKSTSIVTSKSVSKKEYWNELKLSKICFSPFGYGEVCWRDFEAIMAGALLVKPDMAHVMVNPEIFIPYETYIPVSWDFSDVPEKISHYLRHESERNRIAKNAYDVLFKYVNSNHFVKEFSSLIT